MDNYNQTSRVVPAEERLPWETPDMTVESIEEATRGGAFNLNDQDDMFYFVPS